MFIKKPFGNPSDKSVILTIDKGFGTKGESKREQPLSGPKDRSLEAYKEWLRQIITRLIKEGSDINLTEDEWIASWKEYWKDNPHP